MSALATKERATLASEDTSSWQISLDDFKKV